MDTQTAARVASASEVLGVPVGDAVVVSWRASGATPTLLVAGLAVGTIDVLQLVVPQVPLLLALAQLVCAVAMLVGFAGMRTRYLVSTPDGPVLLSSTPWRPRPTLPVVTGLGPGDATGPTGLLNVVRLRGEPHVCGLGADRRRRVAAILGPALEGEERASGRKVTPRSR